MVFVLRDACGVFHFAVFIQQTGDIVQIASYIIFRSLSEFDPDFLIAIMINHKNVCIILKVRNEHAVFCDVRQNIMVTGSAVVHINAFVTIM